MPSQQVLGVVASVLLIGGAITTYVLVFAGGDEVCVPEYGSDYLRWSDDSTWSGGVKPGANDALLVSSGKKLLIDEDVTLDELVIDEDAEVAFSGAVEEITLTARIIHIDGGAMEAGQDDCALGNKVNIVLTGSPPGNGSSVDPASGFGYKVLTVDNGGTLNLHGAVPGGVSWTQLAATANRGDTRISLTTPVGWKVGDRIAIASTDYEWEQAEEREVVGVEEDGSVLVLDSPLEWMHWGELFSGSMKKIDERAEVALLSRFITVRGDDSSSAEGFGCHIMVQAGAEHARISGVEVTQCGQQGVLGRYPIHYHLYGSAKDSYVQHNSIHHNFQRCVVVHGTNELTIRDNVAYDTVGHCYFLEDGIEQENVFERNLGFSVKNGELIPTDDDPSVFWITHPNNVFRDNVAAGGQEFGFWYSLPENPLGPSSDLTVFPRDAPLGEFSGNRAHSLDRDGLHCDNGPDPDGTAHTFTMDPMTDREDDETRVPAIFSGFVAHHIRNRAVWFRGGELMLTDCAIGDCAIAATFAGSENSRIEGSHMDGCIVAGETDNKGNPYRDPSRLGVDGRTLPKEYYPDYPIRGFEFYDGPIGVRNTEFVNFIPNAGRNASALSINRNDHFNVAPGNQAVNLKFGPETHRMWQDPDSRNRDGDKSVAWMDDGSVTGSEAAVATYNDFHVTDKCTVHPNLHSVTCPVGTFGRIQVYNDDDDNTVYPSGVQQSLTLVPLSRSNAMQRLWGTGPGDGVSTDPRNSYSTALALGEAYVLAFSYFPPPELRVRVGYMPADAWVMIGMRYPPSASIDCVRINYGSTCQPDLGSYSAVESAPFGEGYWYDTDTGIVWVKHGVNPEDHDARESPRDFSPSMTSHIESTLDADEDDTCPRPTPECAGSTYCPPHALCGNHGVCRGSTCDCDEGWTGSDCMSVDSCPEDCSGKGTCDTDTGACTCESGFGGSMCQALTSSCDGTNPKCIGAFFDNLRQYALWGGIGVGALVAVGIGATVYRRRRASSVDSAMSAPKAAPAADVGKSGSWFGAGPGLGGSTGGKKKKKIDALNY